MAGGEMYGVLGVVESHGVVSVFSVWEVEFHQ